MRITSIITYFEKRGYKITRDINSNTIVVTSKQGFSKTFESFNQAFNHYFKTTY